MIARCFFKAVFPCCVVLQFVNSFGVTYFCTTTRFPLPKERSPFFFFSPTTKKTNKTGRLDQQAILRHRDVEMCGLSALVIYLFLVDQHSSIAPPPFTPDFSSDASDAGFGKFGHREWYKRVVYVGNATKDSEGGSETKPMAYTMHNDGVKKALPLVTLTKAILLTYHRQLR